MLLAQVTIWYQCSSHLTAGLCDDLIYGFRWKLVNCEEGLRGGDESWWGFWLGNWEVAASIVLVKFVCVCVCDAFVFGRWLGGHFETVTKNWSHPHALHQLGEDVCMCDAYHQHGFLFVGPLACFPCCNLRGQRERERDSCSCSFFSERGRREYWNFYLCITPVFDLLSLWASQSLLFDLPKDPWIQDWAQIAWVVGGNGLLKGTYFTVLKILYDHRSSYGTSRAQDEKLMVNNNK